MATTNGYVPIYRPPVDLGTTSRREIFMSVPEGRTDVDKEESFEERRFLDYLHAYTTTGKPPAPCPPEPTDEAQRAALGLSPLFKPHTEILTYQNTIPDVQAFRPTPVPGPGEAHGSFFQNIVCQPEFRMLSFEELRVDAYANGRRMTASAQQPAIAAPAGAAALARAVQAAPNGVQVPERFQCISAIPAFDKHSFEELRLAFLRSGRELTSQEISNQNATLLLA